MKFDPLHPYRGIVVVETPEEQERIAAWERERRIAAYARRARRYMLIAIFFAGLSLGINFLRCLVLAVPK